ncbi:MAG TPA: hypothetical protein VGI10_26225, partial [Polyangiaceae bacterium]
MVSVAQHLRSTVGRHPVGCWLALAVGALDSDIVAKSDHVAEAEHIEVGVALLIAEAAVSEQRDAHVVGEQVVQLVDDRIFVAALPLFQLAF